MSWDPTPAITEWTAPYTATSPERISALVASMRYISSHGIPGDIVECGVWRGGSMMAVAFTLNWMNQVRRLHLFDTFEGMTEPTEFDVDLGGNSAKAMLDAGDQAVRAYAGLDEVQQNMRSTGYPEAWVSYVVGPVEDTLPERSPDKIALLRLDTDFYESTRHELTHLVPRVVPGGVVIVDDYGHWQGSRRAVDEWLEDNPVEFAWIDYTGILMVIPQRGVAERLARGERV